MSKIYEELRLSEPAGAKQPPEETPPKQEKDLTGPTDKLEKGKSAGDWYLRLDDKSVYGPVTLPELNDWAAQCRIGPDHEVSPDKHKWLAAKDVPELGMEWRVQLLDGTVYGPLNMFAVYHLISDGAVAPNAELVNQKTGETRSADKLLTQEVVATKDQNKRLAQEMKQKDDLLKAEQERIRKLEQKLSQARTAAKTAAEAEKQAPAIPPKTIREQLKKRSANPIAPSVL